MARPQKPLQQKKNGVWFVQVRFGKKRLTESLGTKDEKKALTLVGEKKRRGEKLDNEDARLLRKALTETRGSFGQLKSINLKMTPMLLWKIDNAARDQGMDRSNWIRSVCTAALTGKPPVPHRTNPATEDLLDQVEVLDERARQIVRDLLARVQKLEGEMQLLRSESPKDPFA